MKAKYHANWEFFREWSDDMAYTLGFMFADGCVSRVDNNVSMAVKASDIEVLEQIKEAMEASHPIGVFKNTTPNEDIAKLQLHNATLKCDAMALGLIPGKTYSMAFPEIPEEYLRDFTRGYFDGDGCVNYIWNKDRPGYHGIHTSFACHDRNFLVILGNLLKKEIGIIPKIYPNRNSWSLNYGGRESICLYDWMYDTPDPIFLTRKRVKFEEWLENRGQMHTYKRKCKKCSTPFVRISGLGTLCKACKNTKI
jgi:hypothetical protein